MTVSQRKTADLDEPIVWLGEVGAEDVSLVGGKGANLGELARKGLPVPEAFIVTTRVEHLSASVRAAIVEGYRTLGNGPVAVRSSATAEDLPDATFAGQYDTFLDVRGLDSLLEAIRQCQSSLSTERALAYGQRQGITGQARIAVIVQRMVDADHAGVMFTAHPVTGDRNQVVVDACEGLGEALVSGLVTPDHYVLGRRDRLTEWSRGGGQANGASGRGRSIRPVMSRRSLRELARLGRIVARHFGCPQDIEWASAEGTIWLVQARPMTALPAPPLTGRQRRFARTIADYINSRPYPLDMTTWVPHGPLGLQGGLLTEFFGISNAFEQALPEIDGIVERFVPPALRPTPRTLTAPFRVVSRAARHDHTRWTEDPRFREFERGLEEVARQQPASLSWPALVGSPRRIMALARPIVELRKSYLPRVLLAGVGLWLVLRALGRRALFADLIIGAPTLTAEANAELDMLARRVRADASLARAFVELESPEVLHQLRERAELAEFGDALADFLHRHGHRETSSPAYVSAPTWSEEPAAVLGMLAAMASQPEASETTTRAELAMNALRTHTAMRWSPTRRSVERLVAVASAGIAFREDTHYHMTRPMSVLRRALLEIGTRLHHEGVLNEPEEVFHLRLEELEGIPHVPSVPDAEASRLRAAVACRAARREELADVPMIDVAALSDVPDTGDDALLTGAPAASGRATGPVRVVLGTSDFATLRKGDILVCPYTNPAWTPLFHLAAAVVVDSGSVASHAAIIAREYGIPAIMATGRGTATLVDGQIVTVDGGAGRVTG
ncbi:PEP/pyruvate-binding domain-containing protein [Tenggerimyces flavus]|uniref:PEP/pyruvate-binding domain-containing protein n=1 Tax=Tenggerimyces flavus TaxID=1708749 RepID=A0ABV7YH93_9ACTN|nr:PEP/pyruvate-binding domain-containing protein [Tenggerimyces flavus]MBM7790029.1 pyruvate,water dikinase [Tenggerimyces flavus]